MLTEHEFGNRFLEALEALAEAFVMFDDLNEEHKDGACFATRTLMKHTVIVTEDCLEKVLKAVDSYKLTPENSKNIVLSNGREIEIKTL